MCSIGTTDPWNAAGLGLDVRVLRECGVTPVTVVAAVSAQDQDGVRALVSLDPGIIEAQWQSLSEAGISMVRIGALVGESAVRRVGTFVARARLPVVYDPALGASRGGTFADDATIAAIRDVLLPLASVCTPNLHEASVLSRLPVECVPEMELAADAIRELGAAAVLVTGGHLAANPIDVLVDAGGRQRYEDTRIVREREVRGTGCVLACALAAELARGEVLRSAVERARTFVRNKIAGAVRTGDFLIVD